METQHNFVIDGMGNGVGVEFFFEDIFSGDIGANIAVYLLVAGVFVEDRRAGKPEQLRFGEELFNGLVVLAELGTVAFVEDKDHTLIA